MEASGMQPNEGTYSVVNLWSRHAAKEGKSVEDCNLTRKMTRHTQHWRTKCGDRWWRRTCHLITQLWAYWSTGYARVEWFRRQASCLMSLRSSSNQAYWLIIHLYPGYVKMGSYKRLVRCGMTFFFAGVGWHGWTEIWTKCIDLRGPDQGQPRCLKLPHCTGSGEGSRPRSRDLQIWEVKFKRWYSLQR
jgi:hypothetical protein